MDVELEIQRLSAAVERLAGLVEQAGPRESTAPEILLALVPLLGVVFGCVLLFFFLLWRSRLRREMIRAGQYQPMFAKNIRLVSLLIGLLSVSVGLPMTVLFAAMEGLNYVLLGGLLPLFAGVGFLLFYLFSHAKVN